jgi:outer membrane receptor for Fe3+-dicitrate
MDKLLKENKKTLRRYIRKYDGKMVHGVYVTESGILAAAHLGGAGNVINWFRNGEDFKDANGTPITKYIKDFSGYELNL